MKKIGLLVALAMVAIGSPAMAVEEPSFQTVMHDGAFEVRAYPRLIVAEVTVSGEQKEAASKGFRLLAGYIFGGNKGRQTIAMTAPVAQQPVSEKIAMTAPVTQTKVADSWVVRFTMPSAFTTIEMLPEPNDPRVTLRSLPATRVAVLRFSGLARRSEVEAKDTELLAAVRSHHFAANRAGHASSIQSALDALVHAPERGHGRSGARITGGLPGRTGPPRLSSRNTRFRTQRSAWGLAWFVGCPVGSERDLPTQTSRQSGPLTVSAERD